MGRVQIPLTAHEIQYCVLLAERRNVVKAVHGVKSSRHHTQRSDFELHLIGLMGEYAVAKYLSIKVDIAVSLSGDDKVSDLIQGDHKIQVKTRLPQRPPLYLYFNSPELFRADRTVCALVSSPALVEIIGWISRKEFKALAVPLNFGYGGRVGVTESQLKPMRDWKHG